ncbi:MAG: hypothetical protein R3C62_03045 [Chloroflexota bacterium]
MTPVLTAVKTHYLHALLFVLLWVSFGILAMVPVELIVVGAILAFPLGVWLAGILTAGQSSTRKQLQRFKLSQRQWGGIVFGIIVGVAVGVVLFQAMGTTEGETAVFSNTLLRWGAIAALIGGWLGKWLVGIVGGVSFKIPGVFYVTSWRAATWIAIFFVAVVILLLLSQFTALSEETGKLETAVTFSDLIIPLAILGYIGYWLGNALSGTQQRMTKTLRGMRTSSRWITIGATFLGALLGAVLTIPKQSTGQDALTPNTVGSIAILGGLGWWVGRRLLRVKVKSTRTLLIWALMFAAGGVGLVYNLPGETGNLPNALTTGGLVGLLVGLVQLRFNVWTLTRILGLAAVGVLAIVTSSGLSLGQVNVLAGLFFGLLATMMIFNWWTAKK